jgi:hypothetical protein
MDLSASPANLDAGGSTMLMWSASNADSCTATGGWSGVRATSGSQAITGLNATTSFILSCSGAGGSASGTVTVQVSTTPPAPSLAFWSLTGTVNQNQEATLF